MAVLFPPQGGVPLMAFDYEEALSLLALLNANAAYWNKSLREKLVIYVERMPTK